MIRTLIPLVLSSILAACGAVSVAAPTPEELLIKCWGAEKLDNGNFRLQAYIVNMGEHGWKAGTEKCGGVGLDISPDSMTLEKMYEVQREQKPNDKMGQYVFDVLLDVRVTNQSKKGLSLETQTVSSFELADEKEACKIFENYSGQVVCNNSQN